MISSIAEYQTNTCLYILERMKNKSFIFNILYELINTIFGHSILRNNAKMSKNDAFFTLNSMTRLAQ